MLSLREYKEEYGLFTNICLNVTNDCNCACRYCFATQKPDYMSLEIAITAVDFLMNNLKRKRKLTNKSKAKASLSFFGGEPTLCWDSIIVPLVKYIEENYPNDINLGITTNGTLLNKERIDYLYEHKINPLLSMDGDKETQDYNRPCKDCKLSSFDLASKNIPYLLEKFPNTTFRMTIYEDTCDKLFTNILYAESMGFKNFFCIPDTRHNFSEENLNKLRIELEKYFLYFTGCLINDYKCIQTKFIGDAIVDNLRTTSIDLGFDLFAAREIMRCGLGTTSASIGPYGDIFGCQEQTSHKIEDNIFYIGDIFNGIDKNKHLKLLEEFRSLRIVECEDSSYCNNCELRNICKEVGCPSMSKERFDNFFIQPKTQCKWKQILNELSKGILANYHKNVENYIKQLLKIKEKREGNG